MGRRRRKVVKLPKRRLPTVFLCPDCGKESVKVNIVREENLAVVKCGSCGLTDEIPIKRIYGEIDAYCLFIDNYYTKRGAVPDVSREGES